MSSVEPQAELFKIALERSLYHGQQLCQIVVFDDTLHVYASICDICCVFVSVETSAFGALQNRIATFQHMR